MANDTWLHQKRYTNLAANKMATLIVATDILVENSKIDIITATPSQHKHPAGLDSSWSSALFLFGAH